MINHIGKGVMKYLPLQGARRLKRHFAWHKTSLPVPEKAAEESLLDIRFCQNCETPLTGDFCPDCGQMDRELQRPVWALIWDSADALFDVDSRIFRTIMPLVFLPGHLTRSYNEGKRARYLPPVRLYIISSLIFFLAVSIADVAILKFEFYPADTEEVDTALAELERSFDCGHNGSTIKFEPGTLNSRKNTTKCFTG